MLQYCPYRIAELQTVVDWLKYCFQIQLRLDNTVDPRSESEPLNLDNDQGERNREADESREL
jgi:hypothetical protein